MKAYILLFLLLLPAIGALFVPGFFGASDDLHIGWLFEMDRVIKLGQIPPRFVPDLSFGFGYPLFNFVFPLPFYIGEVFHLLGFSLVDSVKTVFFLGLIFSGFSMYLLLRSLTNSFLSLLGAIIYVYTPYRSTDTYVRGAIGEALSFVFLPLIVLSVIKIIPLEKKRVDIKWVSVGALSLAGLIISHNITAYMFVPFVFLLVLIRFIVAKSKISFVRITSLLFLALLSSCFFWLPALIDTKIVQYDTVFNFIDHFPTLRQLITPFWGYGASVPGPYDGMSFFLGSANILVIILTFSLLFKNWKTMNAEIKLLIIWALISFFIAIIFMNFRSTILWQTLPLLPYFQFPWRFLIITTFVSSLCVISLVYLKGYRLIVLIAVPMVVLLSFSMFHPHDFLGREDDYYINRYIPTPIASDEYKNLQEEYLRLPKETLERPKKNYPLLFLDDSLSIEIVKTDGLNTTAIVNATQSGKVNFSKYNFPGWEVYIDGQKANIETGKPFGQISFEVESGQHRIGIFFKETKLKQTLDLVSLISVVIAILLITPLRKKIFKI